MPSLSVGFIHWYFSIKSKFISGPSGILTLEEQRDVMYMIGGANPIGPLISTMAKPRSSSFCYKFSILV